MEKSSIINDEENITIQITNEDLTYMLNEIEKLSVEGGGQFSLRLETNDAESAQLIIQKVKVTEDNKLEVVDTPSQFENWPLYLFSSIGLFCFITVLYGLYALFQ